MLRESGEIRVGERDLLVARFLEGAGARSSISGATRIKANNASRPRIPKSFLSFPLLRLKLKANIMVPLPARKLYKGVQEPFLELGKIGTIARKL